MITAGIRHHRSVGPDLAHDPDESIFDEDTPPVLCRTGRTASRDTQTALHGCTTVRTPGVEYSLR